MVVRSMDIIGYRPIIQNILHIFDQFCQYYCSVYHNIIYLLSTAKFLMLIEKNAYVNICKKKLIPKYFYIMNGDKTIMSKISSAIDLIIILKNNEKMLTPKHFYIMNEIDSCNIYR
jgi:hypothetical protein